MPETLAELLSARDNDHRHITAAFTAATGLDWHAPTPSGLTGRSVSVVIPAHNNAYSLPTVLDALAAQRIARHVEVIVVDDASIDATAAIAEQHPACDRLIRLPRRLGAGDARNVGVAAADGEVVVFLDADMAAPPHLVADVAVRCQPGRVLIGFRHNIDYRSSADGRAVLPDHPACLRADHRVEWTAPAGVPMFYTGQIYEHAFTAHPLDDTRDFIDLGQARSYYDWDLPRMVVTAMVSAWRDDVIAVGGFHPGFPDGWGTEDTHLGALLIAHGCRVIPMRQAIGFHIDPPDAGAAWQAKFATAKARIIHYRGLLHQPLPTDAERTFRLRTGHLLSALTHGAAS